MTQLQLQASRHRKSVDAARPSSYFCIALLLVWKLSTLYFPDAQFTIMIFKPDSQLLDDPKSTVKIIQPRSKAFCSCNIKISVNQPI